jgi:hypothetical protein
VWSVSEAAGKKGFAGVSVGGRSGKEGWRESLRQRKKLEAAKEKGEIQGGCVNKGSRCVRRQSAFLFQGHMRKMKSARMFAYFAIY